MSSIQPVHPAIELAADLAARRAVEPALRRLHETLRDIWGTWPIGRRTPTQIARELGVDRTTCQRISAIVRDGFSTAMLETMPGPRALRAFADAAEAAGEPATPASIAQLRAAVDIFDELVRSTAGSLARLKRVASGAGDAPGVIEPAGPGPRESLFFAAHEVTRRRALATASVGLYDTRGVGPNQLRHVRASGNHAIIAEPDAVPMLLEAFDGDGGLDDDGWQRTPRLVTSMTNARWSPVPVGRSPGFSAQAVEITRSTAPSDVYIYTVFPVPHPRTLDRAVEESWYMVYSPTAALVFDLYLHESVARSCLVSLDVHLWQTSFANSPHGKWHTRLPDAPTVVQLGRGIDRAASSLHPRQAELTREVFRIADADPSEFIAFRCEERFPVWRAGYRFELDFGSGEGSPPA
jgi:hypothetical protein